jgi:hypothetical protein
VIVGGQSAEGIVPEASMQARGDECHVEPVAAARVADRVRDARADARAGAVGVVDGNEGRPRRSPASCRQARITVAAELCEAATSSSPRLATMLLLSTIAICGRNTAHNLAVARAVDRERC